MPPSRGSILFTLSLSLFHLCRELLGFLSEEQLITLEKALCSSEGLGSLNLSPSKIQQLQKTTTPRPLSNPTNPSILTSESSSPTSDSSSYPTQSNPATPNPQRRDSLQRPSVSHQRSRSLGSHDLVTQTLEARHQVGLELPSQPHASCEATTPEAVSGDRSGASNLPSCERDDTGPATTREGECFPQFEPDQPVVNDLPMAGATPTISVPLLTQEKHAPSPSSSTTKCKQSRKPGRRGNHHNKGPAGFASSDDLMHRLFVAISGVADQLQTNHAKDLRVILKHVFSVCQSEPEPEDNDSAGGKMEDNLGSSHEFMMESSPTMPHSLSAAEGVYYK